MWGDRKSALNIINIPLEEIKPNAYQPRKEFDDESLNDLTNSIKSYGVLQPIVVRRSGKNGYEIIAGERRWRASQKAGLKEIPAIIKDAGDSETAIMALIENLQRENLSFLEEAEGYRQLMQDYGFTQEQLAYKLGKSQSTIANKMRILKMPPEIVKIISREKLSERHARALLKLPDEKLQMQALKQIIDKGLNVRQTEELVDRLIEGIENEKEKEKKKSFKIAIKDVRIFVNSVKKLVKNIKETGINAGYKEIDKGDFIEVVVQIPKR
ncbi:MAG: ParB family transcriptional regulator, chromosome partitioning protein [Thermoanaerobacteraceae bacterium]|jgi:ParB family chromosome partitioning protein|uniref:Nucleoid occlusion protein n=1 Tax=Biomaibacter acetigenes TaxID=2316383 RepID=A0A3G2R9K8_9FIRM|nr:nucleoid occlusion protein [Biomaibacter acetigenes]MDK2877736.1 ParB family transcriptional regulator, chromosome partitioning protein [Thermoanaerobacteraceae bacterium]RKL64516.1 nucleoid occlusion protein [Thermoanaerobacteraceae bacterium SP2]AYO32126.1 nucleoid occlusion protein [Biomaibacter acetigenes]MDN5301898.1 ParB family transcriptional regulator, chromosome partitioning protein [Thermoanaerobacteraceae bacterium]MDN5312689.1 ParB family transcriptional regulator, chromosome pa